MGRAAEDVAALQWQYHPHLCPLQVPKVMRCIHKNMECMNTESAQQSVESLVHLLPNQYPDEVLMGLLRFSPPGDKY